jgi:menaquinone reductase, molybdopterin-binding-like subunit
MRHMPLLTSVPAGSLSRRSFLRLAAAATGGAVAFTGCAAGPNAFSIQSRARLAEDSVSANEAWYATTCAACTAGCGVLVRVVEGRARKIEGNPDHPVNRGKLCARGQAVLQAQYNPDRLRGPLGRSAPKGSISHTGLTWDGALRTLTDRLKAAKGQPIALITRPLSGHQAVIVQRFAAAIGAQWLRLASFNEEPLRAAAKRVFGSDLLPEFDLEHAGYVLSFGANLLDGWLSPVHYSVEYGVFRQGSYRAGDFRPQGRPRGHLVQVDARFSGAAASADEWLPVKPGREGLLALSLAQVLMSSGMGRGTSAEAFYGSLDNYTPEQVAGEVGLAAERIRNVAGDFSKRGPSLVIGGGAAGAHTNGADALSAILGLNLIAGNAGKPGGVLLNAPGPLHDVPSFTSPSPLSDWVKLVDALRAGQMAAVLVHDANPVYELPYALNFRDALRNAPFLASFSSFPDETTVLADLILPAHLPLEEWGDDIAEPAPGYPVVTAVRHTRFLRRAPRAGPVFGSGPALVDPQGRRPRRCQHAPADWPRQRDRR